MNSGPSTVGWPAAAALRRGLHVLVILVKAFLWSFSAALTIFLCAWLGLKWTAPDEFIYDWRTALLSEEPSDQRSDIAMVLVDDDSLARYFSRSPVDRGLIAELVRAIDAAHPRAIGLDFVFDRRSEPGKNDALLRAIKEAKAPVILGVTTGREGPLSQENLDIQDEFIQATGNPESRPAGTLYFGEQESRVTLADNVIRRMGAPFGEGAYRNTFDMLLAEIDGAKTMPTNHLIAWLLRPPDKRSDTFATLYVPTHDPVDGQGDGSDLIPKTLAAVLRGKIVILGGDFIDRDQHRIPLSIETKAPVPGAFIHAQIVAQLIDGRAIIEIPGSKELWLVFFASLMGYLISSRYLVFRNEFVSYPVFLGALVLADLILFYGWKIVLPSSTIFLGWILGLMGSERFDQFAKAMGKRLSSGIGRRSVFSQNTTSKGRV